MKHPYRAGYNFECRVMRWLKKHDFEVIGSRGSHGKADLWALKKNPPNGIPTPFVIQCKVMGPPVHLGRLSKEQQAFKEYADLINARAFWAWRKGRKMMLQELNPGVKHDVA